jgi:hypothetical protein
MAERVYMHVGTPKSGTTYLQAVLWHNKPRLRAEGVLLPVTFQAHYAAAKGVTSRAGRRRETRFDIDDTWELLARRLNRWPGRGVISHELLAPASVEQAEQAKAALHEADVHLVVTARALQQQVPASWQEQVKGGAALSYPAYLEAIRTRKAVGRWFWEVQDIADIARRWGTSLPPEHVHVVTVPPDRSDPTLLWRRYASVLDIDAATYDTDVPAKNISLGPVEVEVLRQVHALRDERFTDVGRQPWTRRLLASRILGQRPRQRIELPSTAQAWLHARSLQMAEAIRGQGFHVVGDLDDLTSWPADEKARSVSSVTPQELAEAVAWTQDRLREELETRKPGVSVPDVSAADGVEGIVELLEHIRAFDTASLPRPRTGSRPQS